MGGIVQKNQLKTGYVLAFNIRLYAKNVNEIGTFFLHFKALKQYINVGMTCFEVGLDKVNSEFILSKTICKKLPGFAGYYNE